MRLAHDLSPHNSRIKLRRDSGIGWNELSGDQPPAFKYSTQMLSLFMVDAGYAYDEVMEPWIRVRSIEIELDVEILPKTCPCQLRDIIAGIIEVPFSVAVFEQPNGDSQLPGGFLVSHDHAAPGVLLPG
ncbi:hypothetical protein [Lysobacter sp. Root667]|uniref:hypothetical protein n=1 Tax=Lysobacter sp. Root667 TaxID=1736581 RepID=UPI0012DDFD55|nr:hypothetical protein [Lysobacter sp. Root667]